MTDRKKTAPDGHALVGLLLRSKAPCALLCAVILAALLTGCAVDQDKLERSREDLVKLCQGAMTATLRAACERAGVDAGPTSSAP